MAGPFRLARVLRLREQIRKLRSHEVAELLARLAALRVAAARLADERERRGLDEAAEAAAGRLTPDALLIGSTYERALRRAEDEHAAEFARLAVALES